MRRLGIAAMLATASAGCFSTWVGTQVAGAPRLWDEKAREEIVPLPGVQERLVVALPVPPVTSTSSAPPAAAEPFALSCRVEQSARDAVYQSAFRYGARWKKMTATAFLIEGALGAVLLLAGDRQSTDVVWGGLIALDALGTAAVFFIPRKDVYHRDERPVITEVRRDCPEGLVLSISDDAFPVDAAGRIGELGEAAYEEWRRAPAGPVLATLDGRSVELRPGLAATITVPVGTLSGLALASPGRGE